MRLRTLSLLMSAMVLLALSACSSSSRGTGEEADIADIWMDSVTFEGGKLVAGAAPAASAAAEAPLITDLTGIDLRIGAPFALILASDYAGSAKISGVIVQAENAGKYFEVTSALLMKKINLFARLASQEKLRGKSLNIKMALKNADGLVGAYSTLAIKILDEAAAGVDMTAELKALNFSGESLHSSGRSAGSIESVLPQLSAIDAPTEISAGPSFSMTFSSGSAAGDMLLILSTPGNDAYKEIPLVFVDGTASLNGVLSDLSLPAGYRLILLVALKNTAGTGLYQVWWPVVANGNEGDGDVDGDAEGPDADSETVDQDTAVDADIDPDADSGDEWECDYDPDYEEDGDADGNEADVEPEVDFEDPLTGCLPECHPPAHTADCDSNGWCRIPAGCFCMGSPEEEAGRYDGEVQHHVHLSHSFVIMQNEVTQAQYSALIGSNPSSFASCGDNCPVENVNWNEAIAYANLLSQNDGHAVCYEWSSGAYHLKSEYLTQQDCPGYRLPTEAEWEYADRAGSTAAYSNGQDSDSNHNLCETPFHLTGIGFYCGDSAVSYDGCWDATGSGGTACDGPHTVGEKAPNPWGLYDMHGNVLEWTWDWYAEYNGPQSDPAGPDSGVSRIYRGGSWYDTARDCRSACRMYISPGTRWGNLGFRLVRTVE